MSNRQRTIGPQYPVDGAAWIGLLQIGYGRRWARRRDQPAHYVAEGAAFASIPIRSDDGDRQFSLPDRVIVVAAGSQIEGMAGQMDFIDAHVNEQEGIARAGQC